MNIDIACTIEQPDGDGDRQRDRLNGVNCSGKEAVGEKAVG